jgi:hypothetical protein
MKFVEKNRFGLRRNHDKSVLKMVVNQFGLVQPIDRLSQGVVVAVATAAH